jgi:hypothetical protein
MTMAKYILKQEAIFALTNEAKTHNNPVKRAYTRAAAIIEQITAEDVQPVKHGKWITKAEDYYKAWQGGGRSWDEMPYFVTGEHIACSECFTEYDVCTEGIEHWIGCPCCLARMDGDSE